MRGIKLQSEYPDLDKYKDNGDIYYYKKNNLILHNPYGPAVIYKNGKTEFHIDGFFIGNEKLNSEYPDLDKYKLKNIIYYYKKGTATVHNPYGPTIINNDDFQYIIDGSYLGKKKLQSEYDDLDKYIDDLGDISYYKKKTNIQHNLFGPAYIGTKGEKDYFVNDEYIGSDKKDLYLYIKDSYSMLKRNIKDKKINIKDKLFILNVKTILNENLNNESINILKFIL